MSWAATRRLSIGLAVYNGERYLAEALTALLSQTYADFELIIADNASTDKTESIARFFASKDQRVRYVRHPRNIGVSRNYQSVLDLARGELFRWAAADDLCAPTALERCVRMLDANPSCVLAYTKTRLIDEHGAAVQDYDDGLHLQDELPSQRFSECSSRLRLCNAQYGVMRISALRAAGGIGAFVAADIVLLLGLTLYGTFCEVPERLFYRRFHPEASSSKRGFELQQYHHPDANRSPLARESRHLWELWRATLHAPIRASEKWSILIQLLRRARGNRDVVASELYNHTSATIKRFFRLAHNGQARMGQR
jgi:glycosyltransferase involved in cell wall biosynthesis